MPLFVHESKMELPEPPVEELEKESGMRGYHVYTAIWDGEIGEQLSCV